MVQKILSASRYTVLIGIFGSLIAALVTMITGGYKVFAIIFSLFSMTNTENIIKSVSVSFLEVIDIFFLSVVFYILAMGLYELFIDSSLELPPWLVVHTLDDLKTKLFNGMVVVMVTYFLGELVNSNGQNHLIETSLSISVIIVALTLYQFFLSRIIKHP
jgi:uncharacterized membrane protein YqhA